MRIAIRASEKPSGTTRYSPSAGLVGRQGRWDASEASRSGAAGRPALSYPPCLSKLFFTSLRDDPADAEMPSHRLLVRAGYLRQLGAGLYSLLPLGFRVSQRVEQVIREEQDRIGGQEMSMPVVHPADVWPGSRSVRRDRAETVGSRTQSQDLWSSP